MKRRLSFLFAVLLALALLAGCKPKGGNPDDAASASDLAMESTQVGSEIQTDEFGNPIQMDEDGNAFSYDAQGNKVSAGRPTQNATEQAPSNSHSGTQSAPGKAPAQPQPATPAPAEPVPETQANVCSISISVSSVKNNMHLLPENKHKLVPGSGMLMGRTSMSFSNGDSAYDILLRAAKQKGVVVDSTYTAMYGSAYIKGIGNIYEKDCGGNSGWLYSVNGSTPGYGCSKYKVKPGDNIQFFYKCG